MSGVKNRNILFTVLGAFFIFLGIVAFYTGFQHGGISAVLWFSYTILLIVGIGLLFRSSYLLASQLNIIVFPYIVWNIDFFYVFFTGNSLFGITDYFFYPGRNILNQLVTLEHVFTIPVCLIAIYFFKLKRKDFWKLSAVQVTLFFFLTRIFSSVEENVNCVFENCLPFFIPLGIYPFAWFLGYGIMIALTTFLLTRIKVFNK